MTCQVRMGRGQATGFSSKPSSISEWQWPLLALTEAVCKKQPKSQTLAAPPQLTTQPRYTETVHLLCGVTP